MRNLTKIIPRSPLLLLASFFPAAALSGAPIVASATDWRTGEDAAISFFDDFATLRPAFYFNGVAGDSTVSDPGELEVGAHDPYRNGLSLQGLEFSADLQIGEYFGGEAIYNLFEDEENNSLDGEFEEIYATLDLEGFYARGGRYLNAFGFQNQTHIHGWDFVDLPLAYGRFLGDHGLRTDGASALFEIPSRWGANLALSFGEAVSHDHSHGDDHSHGHEDHEEEGHDHDEHKEEGHAHGAGEDLLFDGTFATTRLLIPWNQDDFNRWRTHLSLGVGDNAYGEPTFVYATGIAYEWLENGYEPGGARLRASLELFGRSWTASDGGGGHDHHHGDDHDSAHEEYEHDEHSHAEHEEEEHGHNEHGEDEHSDDHQDEYSSSDFGFLAEAIYSPTYAWDFGGRLGYVSGDSKADLDERWRLSPVVTWWANESRTVSLRLQYNLDFLPSSEEQSVWLQLGLAWGSH